VVWTLVEPRRTRLLDKPMRRRRPFVSPLVLSSPTINQLRVPASVITPTRPLLLSVHLSKGSQCTMAETEGGGNTMRDAEYDNGQ
jgi:hypothetical protein